MQDLTKRNMTLIRFFIKSKDRVRGFSRTNIDYAPQCAGMRDYMGNKGSSHLGKDREKMLTQIFCIICAILFAVLFGFSLFLSWVNVEFWNEFVYMRKDNVILNILGIALGLLLTWVIGSLSEKLPIRYRMDIIAAVVGGVCTAVSIYWIIASKTEPQGDQANIVNYAVAYKNGDTSSLLKGGYVGRYQQQLGLITFMRVIFLLFGQGNYKAYQYFSALMVFVIVFFGHKIIRRITMDDIKADIIYLALMLFCIPMYGYTPFVYGEIGSTGLVLLAAWTLLSVLDRFSWWKLLVLAVTCGMMLQLRQNTLIIAIALMIVVLVKIIQKPKKELFFTGGAILAGIIIIQFGVSAIYRPFISEDTKSTPAILFITMGTHDGIEGEPGWHDNYDEDLYREAGYDYDTASYMAWEDLGEFIDKCVSDPRYAARFFTLKMNIQWNVPMYQCLVMNNCFYDEPFKFADDIYFNGNDKYLESFMNIYQLLVYGGVFCTLIIMRKRWTRIENYVLLIGVYGGFLFSLLWEAKPRYVFPYFIIMIPYAAVGIAELLNLIINKLSHNN